MGVQAFQDYVESHCPKGCKSVEMKEFLKDRKKEGLEAVVVLDALSCVRYLYGYNSDWVCGGQWSEMLRNVENFVRSFRQQDIQLIVFFSGEGDSVRLLDWIKTQEQHRQTVHKVLNHVMRQANFPPKRLFFLPPAAKMCLYMAFRSCGANVCCSFSDLHQELVSYSIQGKCSGIIGHDADYLVLNPPAYFSAEQMTVNKKSILLKHIDLEVVYKEMGLKPSRIGLFASLLGSPFIPEETLSSFHWSLVGSVNPSSKNQTNGQSVLPPNNVVIRNMIEYVNQIKDIYNYGLIVSQVFKHKNVDLKVMQEKLEQSVQYYNSNRDDKEEQEDASESKGENEHQYKKRWQHWQQHHFNAQAVVPTQIKETNGQEVESKNIDQLQEKLGQLHVRENNGICEEPNSAVTPKSPVPASVVPGPTAVSPSAPPMTSPPLLFPTPPPSLEGPPLPASLAVNQTVPVNQAAAVNQTAAANQGAAANQTAPLNQTATVDQTATVNEMTTVDQTVPVTAPLKAIIKTITPQVLEVVRQRHQSGQMSECIYQILTRAELTINAALEDEHNTDNQPSPLLYRPIRQHVYGILFDKKAYDIKHGTHDPPPVVKEWCVYRGKKLEEPDLVEAVSMKWMIPELHKLWFGAEATDNLNRMKAFLTCMMSDTPNMTKTTMVPQRLVIMCCVLRYLVQQGKAGQPVLLTHEINAFLAAALSPHISTEFNPSNLSQLKLMQIELRGVQLATMFMRGIEAAYLANDACGCPVPWELVCPWNYFDGKLFMSKYLQAANDATPLELCDGKNARLEKLQRMNWCIMEGIAPELLGIRLPTMGGFPGPGMHAGSPMPFFGFPPNIPGMPPVHSNFIPAGMRMPQQVPLAERPRTRGISSKRAVSGLGGTLEVAGVPVANWGGNRAGRDYNEHNRIVAGGPASVELPSRGRGRGGRGGRRGGHWQNSRNVTWAVEVDKDYDRRIGYKEPQNVRSTNLHQVPDQTYHVGFGDNESMLHPVQGYHGNLPTSIPDASAHPVFTTPLDKPAMNMHMAMNPNPQPMIPPTDKVPHSQVHILSKPPDKLSGQGRGRGIAASLGNNVGGMQQGQMSSKGRGYLLENPVPQTPAT